MQLAAAAAQWGAVVCSSNLGCFCLWRVPCCSSLAYSCEMSVGCSALSSYRVFQPAMVMLSQNRSIVGITPALWKGALPLLSDRQDIPAVTSIFSVYSPFLSKALQHSNSHQPGTVRTSSSVITGLWVQERAQGLLHKGAVLRNKHNKQFIKMEQNTL